MAQQDPSSKVASRTADRTATPRWRRVWETFSRPVFGHDVFVSYSRRDSEYATALAAALASRYVSVYFDQRASPLGRVLPESLRRALRTSGMLVVLATEESAKSENVGREVEEFAATRRGVRVIDVATSLDGAPWAAHLFGTRPLLESPDALNAAKPTGRIVDAIVESSGFWRQSRRLSLFASATLVAILVGSLALVILGRAVAQTRASLLSERENARQSNAQAQAARTEADLQRRLVADQKREVAALRTEAERLKNETNALAQRNATYGRSLALKTNLLKLRPDFRNVHFHDKIQFTGSSKPDGNSYEGRPGYTFVVSPILTTVERSATLKVVTYNAMGRYGGQVLQTGDRGNSFALVYHGWGCYQNGLAIFEYEDGEAVVARFNVCTVTAR